jgi:hypothetical protein
MKRTISVGIMICLLAAALMPIALAATEANGIGIIAQLGHYEKPMEVDCTWTSSPDYIGYFAWSYGATLPPLPGVNWADEIVSITLPAGGIVDVYITDAFIQGDNFELWEIDGVTPSTGHLVGTTPFVPEGGYATDNPNVAWDDPAYSHAKFRLVLTAGKHYFAIRTATAPFGGGGAYIKFCPVNIPPVGGNLLPSNNAVISLITLLGAIGAVTIVVGTRKKREL